MYIKCTYIVYENNYVHDGCMYIHVQSCFQTLCMSGYFSENNVQGKEGMHSWYTMMHNLNHHLHMFSVHCVLQSASVFHSSCSWNVMTSLDRCTFVPFPQNDANIYSMMVAVKEYQLYCASAVVSG